MRRSNAFARRPQAIRALRVLLLVALGLTPVARPGLAQQSVARRDPATRHSPSIAQFIGEPIVTEIVSAKRTDRIAWLAYDRGVRNVFTAVGPDFKPKQVTPFRGDEGIEISGLRISDDGSMVTFVRGISPNGAGWVPNPTADPDGQERAVWAAPTRGGDAWRVSEGATGLLSPDGKWMLFVRDSQIYRASVAEKRPRTAMDRAETPFIREWGSNSNPQWSPDGKKIAFVSTRSDHRFIAIYDVPTRTVSYVVPSVDRDISPTWSPDGKQLAFIRRPGMSFGQIVAQDAAARAGAAGRGGGGGGRGGQGTSPDSSAASRIPGLVSTTFPDGRAYNLMMFDLATGKARAFWRPDAEDPVFGGITSMRWAGRHVVFSTTLQSSDDESARYYSIALDGSTRAPVKLITTDGLVEGATSVALSPDGSMLYYCTNTGDIDRRHIWGVPVSGGVPKQVSQGDGIETWPVVLASGTQLGVFYADARMPMSPAIVPAAGGKARVITTLPADFPYDRHVVPEQVVIKSPDGLDVHNQLFLPRDLRPGERRPAMVFVHGGPARQMLLGYQYLSFYHLFYGVNQWLVDQGYVVISVNYRSGIGYGKAFRQAPQTGSRGNSEYQDVLAAGKYLASRPDVDPTRIGIWGLSYGGQLTAEALSRNSDLFVAGVDLAGVHLLGSSIEADNVSFQSSAASQVANWTSPVLLQQGDDDRNVDFSQLVGLVQLLRANHVYHELMVMPDDVHETLLHRRWLDIFDRMEPFLTRFVWNKETPPPMEDGGGAP